MELTGQKQALLVSFSSFENPRNRDEFYETKMKTSQALGSASITEMRTQEAKPYLLRAVVLKAKP